MEYRSLLYACAAVLATAPATAGPTGTVPVPPARDVRISQLVHAVSADRIRQDVQSLVNFGTRHTLSETTSDTRGIGAARRWLKTQFESISSHCGNCLEVSEQRFFIAGEPRIPERTELVNVLAVLRGTSDPNRYVIMSGDIDSRVSDVMNATSDAPGADDNASGLAGVLEAARVISQAYAHGARFRASIVFVGLSGEEQGLYGGVHMAHAARDAGWDIEAFLNNDMIGNIHGIDGVIDNHTARVFSESPAANTTLEQLRRMRFFGGEVDSPSRQIARYVHRVAADYLPQLDIEMVYRLDRFGRGGHHKPFNDVGYPAVRIMEAHENYNRQHQDVRVEDGVHYGDVISGVDFDYAAKLTALNVACLAQMAWAPAPPREATVGGAVEPAARLAWQPVAGAAGYKVYWRDTTSPNWDHWLWNGTATSRTMEGLVVDNDFFGVAAVSTEGDESPVVFPQPGR